MGKLTLPPSALWHKPAEKEPESEMPSALPPSYFRQANSDNHSFQLILNEQGPALKIEGNLQVLADALIAAANNNNDVKVFLKYVVAVINDGKKAK